jgi:Sensors of blue-light using FAD
MAEPTDEAVPVYQLSYSSHSRIPRPDRPTELAAIFRHARSNNKAVEITGALLITDHYFAQVLEGPQDAVEDLYRRISADTRHEKHTVLGTGAVARRVFPGWSMAQVSSVGHADIPLHSRAGVIHPKAHDHLNADQSQLLKRLREVIGADTV